MGKDLKGDTRLLIRGWLPGKDKPFPGRFVESLSPPLPEGTFIHEQIQGNEVYLYLNAKRGYGLRPDQEGRFGLSSVMAAEWFSLSPRYLKDDREQESRYLFGSHPYQDLRSLDIAALPTTFLEAYSHLNQQGYAMVNNQNPKDRLHLREKPRKDAASLCKFYNGTPFLLLGVKDGWARVRLAGLEGYLMTKYLAFGWNMDQVTPAFPLLTGRDELLGKQLPVYQNPSEDSPVIQRREITMGNDYWIAGVSGEDWFYVYFYEEDLGGFMKQEWFFEGNG